MTHYRITIAGTNAVNDIFNFGFSIDATGVSGAQGVVDTVGAKFDANWATVQSGGTSLAGAYYTGVTFRKITAYERPLGPGPATAVAEYLLVNKVGTDSIASMPSEIAVNISLLTGQPGKRHRGRMYMPAPSTAANNVFGLLGSGPKATFPKWAAAFFGGINVINGMKCCVWSRTDQALRPITAVSVGDQFDVQRRRQNNQGEVYTTVNVSQV